MAEQVSRFLDKDAIFANGHGLYSTGASRVGGDAFVEAEDDDRFYRFRSMISVDVESGLKTSTLAYMQYGEPWGRKTDPLLRGPVGPRPGRQERTI